MEIFRMLESKNFAGLDLVQLHLRIAENPVGNWIYDLPVAELEYAVSRRGSNLEVVPFGAFTEEAIKTLLDLGIRQYATDEPTRFCRILNKLR